MKKLILIIGILISLTTLARFEEQYGANEIINKTYENGVTSKRFSMKNIYHENTILTFPTTEEAEQYFQKILDDVEKKHFRILNYTDIAATKKITFLAGKVIVVSQTFNEVSELVLSINDLDKTDKFEEYLKLNGVHGSIGLKIVNAKMLYKMRDKK